MTTGNEQPVWFVNANAQGFLDQLERFVREGIWENLAGDQSDEALVDSIQVGERIAIRSYYRREPSDLEFETRRDHVYSMTIRAIGVVTRNLKNGRILEVDWDLVDPPREWFFYANGRRVWRVDSANVNERSRWKAEALIAFTFENKDQDIQRFLEDDLPRLGNSHPPLSSAEDPKLRKLACDLMWGDNIEPLADIMRGLGDKGQVIFQGPPGTGKTYVAQEIAKWLTQPGGAYDIVQFHPSYTYEDFVEGFRPTLNEETGQAGYRLKPGPLRRMAKAAQDNSDDIFVLVIDEINRGNLAKILGELYFLLEYRDKEMTLQYSETDEKFRLPKNLWFIGTMNTTDRSIALVDAALRRRFYFYGFYPDQEPISGLLKRWLEKNNPGALWVDDLLKNANSKLSDHHLQIGPSYFMKNGVSLDKANVKFIWEKAVLPYIEEQFFGDADHLKQFEYDALIGPPSSSSGPIGNPPDDNADTGVARSGNGESDAAPSTD